MSRKKQETKNLKKMHESTQKFVDIKRISEETDNWPLSTATSKQNFPMHVALFELAVGRVKACPKADDRKSDSTNQHKVMSRKCDPNKVLRKSAKSRKQTQNV